MLFPNPYMPDAVEKTHMIEVGSSNFIFGALVTGLLLWRPAIKAMR